MKTNCEDLIIDLQSRGKEIPKHIMLIELTEIIDNHLKTERGSKIVLGAVSAAEEIYRKYIES